MSNETNWNKWRLWRTVPSPILSRLWPMNAGSDWPSNRALLTLKPSRRRWSLNSIWTTLQTARDCAEQFSILSPEEKCESKKALPSVVDCYFHHRMNFPCNLPGIVSEKCRGSVRNLFLQLNFVCQKICRENSSGHACAIPRSFRAYLFANSDG